MTTPQRIVALSPALAELVAALGGSARLVGASDGYDAPHGSATANLGGSGNPDIAALHALHPDLALVERGHASAALAPALAAAELQVLSAGAKSVAEAVELAGELGELLDARAAASALTAEIQAAWRRAEERLNRGLARRTLAFTWRDPWIAVGAETYAADLLRLCGAVNVALRLPNRNPRVALERFMSFNPQVILLARDPYPFEQSDLTAFWRFGDVDAIKQRQVHIVDGRLLTRFATRTAMALDTIGGLLDS